MSRLPPRQQLVVPGKWPFVGERLPAAAAEPGQVAVTGCVAQPITYSLEDLRRLPLVERVVDIHCVTRWSLLGAKFRGVRLADVLSAAQPTAAARYVSFVAHSERAHDTSLPLAMALELDVLLALDYEGQPLAGEHGGPVRVVTPGRYFYKSLKWLARIELLAEDRLGFWERTAGYHNEADPWQEQRYLAAGLTKAEATALLQTRDISNRELLSLQVAGSDLTGLRATNAVLRNADFRRCNLSKAQFTGANLTNARFENADLTDADFTGADLEGTDFTGANLTRTQMRGASLFGSSLDPDCQP